jgi:uncharacterized delta-60 repeat protein
LTQNLIFLTKQRAMKTNFILALIYFIPFACISQGTLDPSFGTGGITITDFGGIYDEALAMVLQSDGKIILGGECYNSEWNFALARYNSNGTLDATYGTAGKVMTDMYGGVDEIYSMALQPDGKLIAAGLCEFAGTISIAIARYKTNGNLDSTFGVNGKVNTLVGNDSRASAVEIQPDGKIIIAGCTNYGQNSDFIIARYKTNGNLDSTFGTNGIVVTSVVAGEDFAQALALQTDGKIIGGGYAYNGTDDDFALARYNSNGSLDNTFGTGGKVITDIDNGYNRLFDILIQPDGKIVAAGCMFVVLSRYNTDGSLDNSFGTAGKVNFQVDGLASYATSIILESDGKFLIAIRSNNGAGSDHLNLAKCNADGSLDASFGTAGIVTTTVSSGRDFAYSIILQPDSNVLLGGTTNAEADGDFIVARYTNTIDVSVGDIANNNISIDVYPNPVDNFVEITSPEKINNIKIFSAAGEEIVNRLIDGLKTNIDMSLFPVGLYVIQINQMDKIIYKKIIRD